MARRDDETALSSVTILKSDDEKLERICEKSLERATKVYLARLLIRYGIEHIDQVLTWYGDRLKKQ
jgi:hypothetical protein